MIPHVGDYILSFTDFGLNKLCIEALEQAGYKKPTELQAQLIPLVNEKKNVLVKNHSASGKTGAFLIPAINYILNNPVEEYNGTRILVLTSRKDRVNQIKYTIKRIGDQAFRFGFIVSGRPYQPQMRLLRRPLDMLIATPGRLNDLAENGKADFSHLEMLIIDDLSSVYHKEFQGLVDRILAEKKNDYPVIVFLRAEEEVLSYARSIVPDAAELEVAEDVDPITRIPQAIYQSDDYTHKIALMDYMLDEYQRERTLIFTGYDKSAKTLVENMKNHGHNITLASDLSPQEQATASAMVISDQDRVNFESWDFDHVIHFEMPKTLDAYKARLHNKRWDEREEPMPFLLNIQEREVLQKIEGYLGFSLPVKSMAGLDPLKPFAILPPIKPSNNKGQEKKAAHKDKGQKSSHKQQAQGSSAKQYGRNRHQAQGQAQGQAKPKQTARHNPHHTSQQQQQEQQDRRGRKGAYGRLNGGVHRKRDGDHNEPRKHQQGVHQQPASYTHAGKKDERAAQHTPNQNQRRHSANNRPNNNQNANANHRPQKSGQGYNQENNGYQSYSHQANHSPHAQTNQRNNSGGYNHSGHNNNNNSGHKTEIRRKKPKLHRNYNPIMSDGNKPLDFPVLKERGESQTEENKVVVKYKEKRWGSFNK